MLHRTRAHLPSGITIFRHSAWKQFDKCSAQWTEIRFNWWRNYILLECWFSGFIVRTKHMYIQYVPTTGCKPTWDTDTVVKRSFVLRFGYAGWTVLLNTRLLTLCLYVYWFMWMKLISASIDEVWCVEFCSHSPVYHEWHCGPPPTGHSMSTYPWHKASSEYLESGRLYPNLRDCINLKSVALCWELLRVRTPRGTWSAGTLSGIPRNFADTLSARTAGFRFRWDFKYIQ